MSTMSAARRKELLVLKERAEYVDRLYRVYLKSAIVNGKYEEETRSAYKNYLTMSNELVTAASNAHVHVDPAKRRKDVLLSLTPKVRTRLAPILYAGLTGSARDRWIATGVDLADQILEDEGKSSPWTDGRLGKEETVPAYVKRLRELGHVPYDTGMPPALTTNARTRADGTRTFTGAQLAKKLGADPRELRSLIRRAKRTGKLNIDAKTYTLEQCKEIARVYRAWAKESK